MPRKINGGPEKSDMFMVNAGLTMREDDDLGQYRYRTSALTGPWRESFGDAVKDAARAGQILFDHERTQDFRWVVPGKIEEDGSAEARTHNRA